MKIDIQQIISGQEEICIRYREMTPELQKIIELIGKEQIVIVGKREDRKYRISPKDISILSYFVFANKSCSVIPLYIVSCPTIRYTFFTALIILLLSVSILFCQTVLLT